MKQTQKERKDPKEPCDASVRFAWLANHKIEIKCAPIGEDLPEIIRETYLHILAISRSFFFLVDLDDSKTLIECSTVIKLTDLGLIE